MKRRAIMFLVLFFLFTIQLSAQDTIIVSIAHGSKPEKGFPEEHKTIGGKRGGHVVIEMDGYAYGFFFKGSRIHIFPHGKNKNGTFQKESIKQWQDETKDKKVTSVYIPVTDDEKKQVLQFYQENLKSPSYDYSFFGQRCASSVYMVLKHIKKLDEGSYVLNAFYPGQLRRAILKQNEKNKYRITVQKGTVKRKWEGD